MHELLERMKDEQLLLEIEKGNELAMDTLLNRYFSLVKYRVREYYLSGGEEEDLLQEDTVKLMLEITVGFMRGSLFIQEKNTPLEGWNLPILPIQNLFIYFSFKQHLIVPFSKILISYIISKKCENEKSFCLLLCENEKSFWSKLCENKKSLSMKCLHYASRRQQQ